MAVIIPAEEDPVRALFERHSDRGRDLADDHGALHALARGPLGNVERLPGVGRLPVAHDELGGDHDAAGRMLALDPVHERGVPRMERVTTLRPSPLTFRLRSQAQEPGVCLLVA